jgi:hypothetical protein
MDKTSMYNLLKQIGALKLKSKLSKEQIKDLKILIADGMIIEIKRGKGNPTLLQPTSKGKLIIDLSDCKGGKLKC